MLAEHGAHVALLETSGQSALELAFTTGAIGARNRQTRCGWDAQSRNGVRRLWPCHGGGAARPEGAAGLLRSVLLRPQQRACRRRHEPLIARPPLSGVPVYSVCHRNDNGWFVRLPRGLRAPH